MTIDARKRQKKLALKEKKRKEKRKLRERVGSTWAVANQIAIAARSPTHECLVPKTLSEQGLGTLILSRKLPENQIAASFFLLDIYCLGVKNAFISFMSSGEYSSKIDELVEQHGPMESLHPACFKKLIEGGITYAKELGFKPHDDYRLARRLFGDIDASACPTGFEYGKDGKPFFLSGPSETPEQMQHIIKTLGKKCGPDGFHVMAAVEDLE